MPHEEITTLDGTLNQLLFSPRGTLEGVLINQKDECVQVSFEHDDLDAQALNAALGEEIVLKATRDDSPKCKGRSHPVFKLHSIVHIAGKHGALAQGKPALSGIVTQLHFAKHGEPNGVILDSGEFIHTRPPAMKKLKLKVRSKVTVRGDARMTVLGTPLIEAREVNHVFID